ncbi:hypothetical protein PENSPDRAFT_749971 [Peniophora sp. CONT]|nr:hypothetical protein PENSPDRAFT_749971 [Peniophora sp. CONT]
MASPYIKDAVPFPQPYPNHLAPPSFHRLFHFTHRVKAFISSKDMIDPLSALLVLGAVVRMSEQGVKAARDRGRQRDEALDKMDKLIQEMKKAIHDAQEHYNERETARMQSMLQRSNDKKRDAKKWHTGLKKVGRWQEEVEQDLGDVLLISESAQIRAGVLPVKTEGTTQQGSSQSPPSSSITSPVPSVPSVLSVPSDVPLKSVIHRSGTQEFFLNSLPIGLTLGWRGATATEPIRISVERRVPDGRVVHAEGNVVSASAAAVSDDGVEISNFEMSTTEAASSSASESEDTASEDTASVSDFASFYSLETFDSEDSADDAESSERLEHLRGGMELVENVLKLTGEAFDLISAVN